MNLSLSSAGLALALALFAGAGCAAPAPATHPVEVSQSVIQRGETVYLGSVFPLSGPARDPTFVYERRVEEREGALVSTHVTREPSGAVALAESAAHSPDYSLVEYTLHTNQLGQSGTVRVDRGQVSFHLVHGATDRTAVEHPTADVVVGPTLVGYIVRRLEALRAGRSFEVRLAVLDRLETLGFVLEAVESPPEQTRVRMTPSSFLVGLIVDPIDFTFDTGTSRLVRLEGRVPPKVRAGDGWSDLDARVEYRFVAAAYR